MTWNNDAHGLVFGTAEAKLYYNGEHTWAMKLSQLDRQQGACRILTYSLDAAYVGMLLARRPSNIFLLCHVKFEAEAFLVKMRFPEIRIRVHPRMHSKLCLIEPATVYVSSADFGNSHQHETTLAVRSVEAHDAYVANSFSRAWQEAHEICPCMICW